MAESDLQEQQFLEKKLHDAIEEAWAKANVARDETLKGTETSTKTVWLAAEATEYSCLLYSLTYGLEDVIPPLKGTKGLDSKTLIDESLEALKLFRDQPIAKHEEAYRILRNAAHGFQTAYMDSLKKQKKPR